MSKRILLPVLFFLLICSAGYAQQDTLPRENWEAYMAKLEKSPGSVMVDMALKSIAPREKFSYLLITGVKFIDCQDNGLPSKREFTDLYKISDTIKAQVDKTVSAIAAGTVTYQCQRLDYFYITDTAALRQQLVAIYKKRFPEYMYYINIKEDKKWDTYLNFLYPNEETLEYIENQKVLEALENGGDKLVKARLVDHWAYFKTAADRNCFSVYLVKNKFKTTIEKSEDPGFPFRLHFARTDKVNIAAISKLTLELKKQAAACHGQYDGWETFVVK